MRKNHRSQKESWRCEKVPQVRMITIEMEMCMTGRSTENSEDLKNEDNKREQRAEDVNVVEQEVAIVVLMSYLWRSGSDN